MKRLRAKIKNIKAFSLAETLLAILIMLFVSTIMVTGMPAAISAYEKVIIGANAKSMLSTAITALHDEIGTAWKVEDTTANSNSITYFNASTGAKATIKADSGGAYKGITIQDYLSTQADLIHDVGSFDALSPPRHLIPDTNSGMYVTYSNISYFDGVVTITELRVCKDDGTELASLKDDNKQYLELKIRVISKDLIG